MADVNTKGKYRGQVRDHYNILEQWDGKKWQRVPNFINKKDYWPPAKINFDVEDALHTDEDAADRAFRPR